MDAAVATRGHNNPPPESPFEGFEVHISDLFAEATNFLDGGGVQTEGEAQAIAKLLDLARTASKDADKARAAEKKPHDDAAKAVQARWKPLLDRCDLITATCKKAMAPWLLKQEEVQRAAAAAARAEADARAAAAAEAVRAADVTDLAAREDAETLLKDARRAEADANRAEKARPQTAGGIRATTLRSYFTPVMTNPKDALTHYMAHRPDDLKAFLLGLAQAEVQAGFRSIPGFEITEERRVV